MQLVPISDQMSWKRPSPRNMSSGGHSQHSASCLSSQEPPRRESDRRKPLHSFIATLLPLNPQPQSQPQHSKEPFRTVPFRKPKVELSGRGDPRGCAQTSPRA